MRAIGAASRRPLVTWNDQPLGSYAEVVGRNIWASLTVLERDNVSIQELLCRFWAQVKCVRCDRFGACEHRDRRRDLALIIPPQSSAEEEGQ